MVRIFLEGVIARKAKGTVQVFATIKRTIPIFIIAVFSTNKKKKEIEVVSKSM